MTTELLIRALPEIYQPIYGHPEYVALASRPCADRLSLLLSIYDRLTLAAGRSLRVLDLGCAQGYFAFMLAARGATVSGIDRLDANIALCHALADENPELTVQFEVAALEDVLDHLKPGVFDLVIGMSVMHHLCEEKGAEWTRLLMKSLVNKVDAAIFEVALKTEPLPWAPQQADTPDWLYLDFPFVAAVAEFPTHLSDIQRPIYFASHKFWLTNHAIESFEHWTLKAHELEYSDAYRNRRYFENADKFLKLFQFQGSHGTLNRAELEKEIEFLKRADIAHLNFPKLLDFKIGKNEGWILREKVEGNLLSTCLLHNHSLNASKIMQDVLRQLADLESLGLYHEDLRVWNILIRPDGSALLLDYGSITSTNQDREYPQDWRIPLLILLVQLFEPNKNMQWPLQPSELHIAKMPANIAEWVERFWYDPPGAWDWQSMFIDWRKAAADGFIVRSPVLAETVQKMMDEVAGLRLDNIEMELSQVTQRQQSWDQQLAPFHPIIRLIKKILGGKTATLGLSDASRHPHRTLSAKQVCPVCREGYTEPYSHQSWSDQGIRYRLQICERCATAHTFPLPTAERLTELYRTAFDYRWYQDHLPAKLRDARIRIDEYRGHLGASMLDYGGGLGYLSLAARETGIESQTYDPYTTPALPYQHGWDSVVALHSLEHSNDLNAICSQFRKLLKPNGKLILAVPNFSGSGYRERGMKWVWAQPPLFHIFHFTPEGIIALLSRHGFSDIQVSFHERWDANYYADVLNAERFRKWDSAWGWRFLRSIPGYRKLVAAINSKRRFNALERSMHTPDQDRAELQIVATLTHP